MLYLNVSDKLNMDDNETFVDFCLDLCKSDKKTILKKVLKSKFECLRGSTVKPSGTSTELPKNGCELLRMDPCPDDFVEYAFSMCALENHMNKEEILKTTLLKKLEDLLTANDRKRAPTTETEPREKKRRCVSLPKKLCRFVTNSDDESAATVVVMNTMTKIIPHFFPSMSFVLPCVYGNKGLTEFLVYIPDRHVNRWAAAGSQCTFAWKTPEQDEKMSMFAKVIKAIPRVHVIRERKRELMYMGRCREVEDVSSSGTCTMFVS